MRGNENKKLRELYRKIPLLKQKGYTDEQINYGIGIETHGKLKSQQDLYRALGVQGQFETPGQKALGMVASAYEGATAGWGGELAETAADVVGGISPALAGGAGGRVGGAIDNSRRQFQAEEPGIALGSEIAGAAGAAFATGAPIATKVMGAGALPAKGLVSRAIGGGARMGTLGAVEGAVYGAGAAEPGRKVGGAAMGAGLGLGAGAAMGTLMPFGGALMNKGLLGLHKAGYAPASKALSGRANRMAGQSLADELTEDARLYGTDTIEEIIARMRSRNPADQNMLIDEGGMLARAGRTARNVNPALEESVVPKVRERAASSGYRLANKLREFSGVPMTAGKDVVEDTAKQSWRKNTLQPFKDDLIARGKNVFGHMKLGKMRTDFPELDHYINQAGDMGHLQATGRLRFEKAWDVVQLMDDDLSRKLPQSQKESLFELRNEWVDMIGDAAPEFSEMRNQYRAIISRSEAYEAGGRMAANATPRDITEFLKKQSPEDVVAFKQGFLDKQVHSLQMRGKGGRLTAEIEGSDIAEELVDSYQPYNLERFNAVFGDNPNFPQRWREALHTDFRQMRTAMHLTGNSTTALQLEDAMGDIVITRGPSLLQGILDEVFKDPQLRKRVAFQIGKILADEGPDAALAALQKSVWHQTTTKAGVAGVLAVTGKAASLPGATRRKESSLFDIN